MKQAYVIGTNTRVDAILQRVPGAAGVTGFEDDGTPIWEGHTDLYWDDQVDALMPDGGLVYIADGDQYPHSQIEFRDEGEEDDE